MPTTIDLTNYNALIDDDGTNTVGSLITKASYASVFLTPIQTALTTVENAAPKLPGTSAPTTTGTQTALAIPTGTGDLVIYANNATLLTVQGIAAGLSGQRLTIVSKGAGQVDFAHAHASGTALGKLSLFAATGLTSLAAGSGVAVFQYDLTLTKWRLVSHEQGAWITRTFAAGNYTASAGNWTVASAVRDAYWLKGRSLHFSATASGTTSGTPVTVRVALPAGFSSAGADTMLYYVQGNGSSGSEGGYATSSAGGLVINYQRFANTTFGAGTVTVSSMLCFEVQ
jgi:hypothetical protein